MSLIINTNVASLNSQRQLMQSGSVLDQATERLSSGNRINSAKDDAAGLAIANRMTSQIRGLDQAIRNANDGVSMIQTAEGALQEVTNILQRIGELAVQSASEIYNDGDRAFLQSEVAQLIEELDRISSSTSFNGQKLLDGTLGKVNLQVGAEANQVMTVEVGAMDSKTLGGVATGDVIGAAPATGSLAAALGAITGTGDLTMTINGQDVGDLSNGTVGASLADKLNAINSNISGITASALTEMVAGTEGDGVLRGANRVTLALTDPDGAAQSFEIGDTGSLSELADKINAKTGGQIKAEINDNGRLVLSNAEGGTISVVGAAAGDALGIAPATQEAQLVFTITDQNISNVNIAYGDDVIQANIGVNAREGGAITGTAVDPDNTDLAEGDLIINGVAIGAAEDMSELVSAINAKSSETGVVASTAAVGTDAALTLTSVDGSEMSIAFKEGVGGTTLTGLLATNDASTLGNAVADLDISTAAGAQRAIATVERALTTISETRADLGAVNNRLDFTISNLANVSEKTSAARARIMDADFAAETANLSRAQVLQQAATAMLAQANARPQQVLQLLQ